MELFIIWAEGFPDGTLQDHLLATLQAFPASYRIQLQPLQVYF